MSKAQEGRMQNAVTGGSPFSSSGASTVTDAQSRRVSNACQGCKRRRAKCLGYPAPCERCRKLNSFCHFDQKLDTRRKTAWTESEIQQRKQYTLHAVLHALRCNDDKDVNVLLKSIRQNDSPQELAQCLLRQIHCLQDRQIIAKTDLDIHDVLSLAVEGLTQGPTGPKPYGSGAWSTSSSLAMSEFASEQDSGQQTDDHIPAAYLGFNPAFDPEFDIGPLPSDHTGHPEALPQFTFDPLPIYYEPTTLRQPMQPFGDSLSPLSSVENDAARSLGLGYAAANIEVPSAIYLTEQSWTSSAPRLASSHPHLKTIPATSIPDDRMSAADTVIDAPIVVDTVEWAASQRPLDGFSGLWAQDIPIRAGRLQLTVDPGAVA